jgi:flagellar basal body-associated protein FliL
MAEKEAKKADKAEGAKPAAAAEEKGDKKKGGGIGAMLGKTPVMLGGVMLLEAVVLFAGFKFLMGGPKHAEAVGVATAEAGHGADAGGGDGEGGHGADGGKKVDRKAQVEIPICEFRAPNKQSGRTFIYDVAIFALTKGENADKVKETIKGREALIKDRVRTIIAQSDPEKLEGGSEPNLDTLRRQVKVQLDDVIGEGIIEEVLVPRCIPFRTDY